MPEGWVQRSEGNEASFFLAALFSPERGREKATRWRGGAAACGGKKATWGSDGGAAKLGGHASREKAEIHSLLSLSLSLQFNFSAFPLGKTFGKPDPSSPKVGPNLAAFPSSTRIFFSTAIATFLLELKKKRKKKNTNYFADRVNKRWRKIHGYYFFFVVQPASTLFRTRLLIRWALENANFILLLSLRLKIACFSSFSLSPFFSSGTRKKERESIASRIDLANSKQPILRFECTAVLRAQIRINSAEKISWLRIK